MAHVLRQTRVIEVWQFRCGRSVTSKAVWPEDVNRMLSSRDFWTVVVVGTLLGGLGVMLSVWGNPENSGICVSCFIENSSGALGFHDNPNMQYLRPELIGFVLGSTASALLFREFRSRGGSAPLSRLFLGMFMIFGCAVFIGCPIKLFLRITAGDLTAVAGVIGLGAFYYALLNGVMVQWLVEPERAPSGHDLAEALRMILESVEPRSNKHD